MPADQPGDKLAARQNEALRAWRKAQEQARNQEQKKQRGKGEQKKYGDHTKEHKPRGDMAKDATAVDRAVAQEERRKQLLRQTEKQMQQQRQDQLQKDRSNDITR